jgi:hypothetical protein
MMFIKMLGKENSLKTFKCERLDSGDCQSCMQTSREVSEGALLFILSRQLAKSQIYCSAQSNYWHNCSALEARKLFARSHFDCLAGARMIEKFAVPLPACAEHIEVSKGLLVASAKHATSPSVI